jgi:hypothetical protein
MHLERQDGVSLAMLDLVQKSPSCSLPSPDEASSAYLNCRYGRHDVGSGIHRLQHTSITMVALVVLSDMH